MPRQTETPVRLFALGTPHGLDQLAWVVAGYLSALDAPWLDVRCIRDPLRVGATTARGSLLCILDTTLADLPSSPLWRYRWPDLPVETARPVSTHAVDLRYALELGTTLENLPPVVLVYALSAASWAEPSQEMPPDEFLRDVANRLFQDLRFCSANPDQARTGPVLGRSESEELQTDEPSTA